MDTTPYQHTETITIAAPPDAVYALVADVTRMGEWSPETVSAEWIEGSIGPAVGARFKGNNKLKGPWSTKCTVTAADPGREFAFTNGDTNWRYRFEARDGGVDVIESFEIVKLPGRVGRLMTKLGTGVSWDERPAQMVAGMEETLRRLKAAAEAG